MSNKPFSSSLLFCAALGFVLAQGAVTRGAELTGFSLAKEGNRYVGEQAKDKVVQIRTEKSLNSLTPNIWYIVYYEPDATLKATEVKFAGDKMQKVSRPLRLLEPVSGDDEVLDRKKLKVDSDVAIKTALKEPPLKDLKVVATELKLERVGQGVLGIGGPGEPVWKVKLWAARPGQSYKTADVGEVWISTAEGKVVKSDLHPDSLD